MGSGQLKESFAYMNISTTIQIPCCDNSFLCKNEHLHNTKRNFTFRAQRVGFFNIGSGRVLDKIPGSGSGRVG